MKMSKSTKKASTPFQYVIDRQTGVGAAKCQARRAMMIRSMLQMEPVHEMQYLGAAEAEAAGLLTRSQIAERCNISGLKFNRPGYLIGTSYWSHGSIALWNWQSECHNERVPVHSLTNCPIIRFNWLYSHNDAHIVAVSNYGEVNLIDVHRQMSRSLMGRQILASVAFDVHPDLPYNVVYGMRSGLIRNFDVRKACESADVMHTAKNKDGSPYEIYSLKINPMQSQQFAVAGCYEDVRIYDRRNLDQPVHSMYMSSNPARRDGLNECVQMTNERRKRRWNLQQMVFNYNGTHLALTCGYDAICLFDTSMKYPIGSLRSNYLKIDDKRMTSIMTGSVIYGLEYFGQKSDFLIAAARGYQYNYDEHSEFSWSCKQTSLYIWDTHDQKLIRRAPMGERNWNFAVHPNQPVVATALDNRGIQLWGSV